MCRLLTIVLVSLFACQVNAQTANPFEVRTIVGQTRADTIREETTLVEEKSQETSSDEGISGLNSADSDTLEVAPVVDSNNPFDVGIGRKRAETVNTLPVKAQKKASNRMIEGPSKGVVLIYTIIALVLLSVSIALNRVRFKLIISSLINGNALKTLERGSKAWTDMQSVMLYILFFANGAFVLWILNTRLHDALPIGFFHYLIGLVVLYAGRHLFMSAMSKVYSLDSSVEQFNYSIALHNIVVGILLIPFILSLGYVADDNIKMIAIGLLLIVGLLYVLRQSKGFLSALTMRDLNLFYFFIYLCAFEITPILIAWKLTNGAL